MFFLIFAIISKVCEASSFFIGSSVLPHICNHLISLYFLSLSLSYSLFFPISAIVSFHICNHFILIGCHGSSIFIGPFVLAHNCNHFISSNLYQNLCSSSYLQLFHFKSMQGFVYLYWIICSSSYLQSYNFAWKVLRGSVYFQNIIGIVWFYTMGMRVEIGLDYQRYIFIFMFPTFFDDVFFPPPLAALTCASLLSHRWAGTSTSD